MTPGGASQTTSRAVLPRRAGGRPQTTPATPHVQLDQPAPAALQAELWRRMVNLEGVRAGHSLISEPSSRALHLDPALALGPREAYLVEREFAHLHGDGSGSLHLTLPEPWRAEAIANGWGEIHPAARAGIAPPTLMMLYGPRTDEDLAVVWQLVEASYHYARGPLTANDKSTVATASVEWLSYTSRGRGSSGTIATSPLTR